MKLEQWLRSPKTIKRSQKPYAHFDYRTNILDQWEYISKPENIAHHGFWPFIHYERVFFKYNKKTGKEKKARDICYASHIDSCIFQYYSFLLNERYNDRLVKDDLNMTAIAYRTNLEKQNNLHFAHRAIRFIQSHKPCYIMIGDFSGFFDHLDHAYLKERWCDLLGLQSLPVDHYAVFKNITRYSKWERSNLLSINGLKNDRKGLRELNAKQRIITEEQFKVGKKAIEKNTAPYGIPQGSPISAVLANIYMLDADKKIQDAMIAVGGLYMRYSDDFIVVIPNGETEAIKSIMQVKSILDTIPGLELEPRKTQYFRYNAQGLANCGMLIDKDANCKKNVIHFLGISFDGQAVSIGPKSVTKYYYRMYRKGKTIKRRKGISPTGKHISNQNIYENYSKHGKQNYLSYIGRAEEVFPEEKQIRLVSKRHMQRIRRAISYKGQVKS